MSSRQLLPGPATRRADRAARAFRLRLQILAYLLRKIGPVLLAVAAYMLIATQLVRWDLRRAGQSVPDFQETFFSVFMLLSFEPTDPFPPTAVARAIFWLTPVLGIFLIAEGLLKVGASLFDPAKRQEVWVSILTDQLRDHVVVCGLGHVGYRVVEELCQLGEDIVAIESEANGQFLEAVRARGIPIHLGDARRDELLMTVGIARAKAVVCATSNDLANLEIALDAKRMNPTIRVVMRMFDQRLAGKVGGALDLDESFSTSSLAAPIIAMQATQRGVRSAYRLCKTVRVTAEVVVGGGLGDATVVSLEELGPFRVVSLRRAGAPEDAPYHSATAGALVREGDLLIIDVAAADLSSVRRTLAG